MRAIVINSEDRTITETDLDGSLESLQRIVGGMIEPVTQGLDGTHHCYVNEELRPAANIGFSTMTATRSELQC